LLALWIGRSIGRRDKVRNSCDTIMRELLETKESLQGEESRIHYYFSESSPSSEITSIKKVDYRKNIIVSDAYDSILHSGLFTEFSPNTQHTLSTLYDRIKTHNRIVISIIQFEEKRRKVLEYELYLTGLEPAIINQVFASEKLVKSERYALISWSRLKKRMRLKGNLDDFPEYGS
jgi:hypothetical protein